MRREKQNKTVPQGATVDRRRTIRDFLGTKFEQPDKCNFNEISLVTPKNHKHKVKKTRKSANQMKTKNKNKIVTLKYKRRIQISSVELRLRLHAHTTLTASHISYEVSRRGSFLLPLFFLAVRFCYNFVRLEGRALHTISCSLFVCSSIRRKPLPLT